MSCHQRKVISEYEDDLKDEDNLKNKDDLRNDEKPQKGKKLSKFKTTSKIKTPLQDKEARYLLLKPKLEMNITLESH